MKCFALFNLCIGLVLFFTASFVKSAQQKEQDALNGSKMPINKKTRATLTSSSDWILTRIESLLISHEEGIATDDVYTLREKIGLMEEMLHFTCRAVGENGEESIRDRELVQLFRKACAEEKGRLDSAELGELHWALGRWFRGPQNPPPGEGQQGLGEGTVVGDDGRDGKRRTRRQTRDGTEAKSHPPDSHSRILALLDRMPLDGEMRKWAKEIIIGQPVDNLNLDGGIFARLNEIWTFVDKLIATKKQSRSGSGISCAHCEASTILRKTAHQHTRGSGVRVRRQDDAGMGYLLIVGLIICVVMGPAVFVSFMVSPVFWVLVVFLVFALHLSGTY